VDFECAVASSSRGRVLRLERATKSGVGGGQLRSKPSESSSETINLGIFLAEDAML